MTDVEEVDVWVTPHDLDHLNAGQPVFKGIGEEILLVLRAASWDELKAMDKLSETEDEICPECAGTVSTITGIGGTNWRCEDCGWTASQRPSRIGTDSSKMGDRDE